MATNIGPKIYIDGWADYRKQLQSIMNDTKMLNSEMQKLTSSFDADNKTVKGNAEQKRLLTAQIDKLNQQLKVQQSALQECAYQLNDNGEHTEKMAEDTKKWQTEVNKTETELAKLKSQLNDMPTSLEVVKKAVENNNSAWKRNAEIMASVGASMTKYVSLPIIGAITASVKAAADWESGFTGVKKTVDEIYDANGNLVYSYQELDKALRDVAGESVIAYDELLATAEISGQLGIAADKVAEFSDIMLKLGASTTMTSEEAATSIAKILNITNKGMPITIDQTERFANVLVELGNNFATTEGDISLMATRLASAGTVAGLSTDQILALATAMSSVGIRADAGGSSMAQVLVNLEKRVATFKEKGGDSLELVAQIAGTTAEQFAETWGKKPIDAISAFIKGLGSLDEEAQSTSIILEELDMDGIRQSNMIKALSQAYPLLSRAISMANDEWYNGNALMTEYEKRENTLNAQIQKFKNNLGLLGTELGETLLPTINELLQNLIELVKGFRELNPGTKEAIVKFGLLVAAVGPAISILSKMVIVASNLKAGLGALGLGKAATDLSLISTNASGAATALGGSGGTSLLTALKSIGSSNVVQAGGLAALILYAGYAAFNFDEEVEKWKTSLTGLSDFIDDLGNGVGDGVAKFFGYDSWEECSTALQKGTNQLKDDITKWSQETFGESGVVNKSYQDNIKQTQKTSRAVVQEFDYMGNQIKTTTSKIETNTYSDFDLIQKDMVESINKGKQGIKTQQSSLESTMREVANTAAKPIIEEKNSAWSYGSDFGGGLASGLRSKLWEIRDAAINIGNNIRSYLHFTRPDEGPLRDYEKWMPHFIEGLAKGIDDNIYRLDDAANNLATALVMDAPISGVGGTQSSYNYGGVVINVYGAEGQSEERLAEEIELKLAQRLNGRKAVFGQ